MRSTGEIVPDQAAGRKRSPARIRWLRWACIAGLLAAMTAFAQDETPSKRGVRDMRRSVPAVPSSQNDGMPREIGQMLEVSEAARQSGNYAVRHVRDIGNATYDWLLHLRISVVENDYQAIQYDIQNCQLLYELIQQNNPSAILLADIQELRQNLAENRVDDFSPACLGLQLDIEKYEFLYPLADLRAMTNLIVRQSREGQTEQCQASADLLEEAVALPNIDRPIASSTASFEKALALLDKGENGLARDELKKAANLISLLNVGTYLCESEWYLAKAKDALIARLFGITLASLKKTDSRLKEAEDRAWSEMAAPIASVRQDLAVLINIASDRKGKTTLTPDKLLGVAKRMKKDLLIAY
jgi:hypothetical protein